MSKFTGSTSDKHQRKDDRRELLLLIRRVCKEVLWLIERINEVKRIRQVIGFLMKMKGNGDMYRGLHGSRGMDAIAVHPPSW